VRVLAFHLPQFHPIPENDEWWGAGFTEWRNVVRARPLFPGHYQPHLPADLGFYDLRLAETRAAQAEMAAAYGVSGFCYYHYWFNGRRLLERPVDEILRSQMPRFPFCLCWANENWSRRWDGRAQEILVAQSYSHEDDRAHIRHMLPALADSRYIRIDGRPLFLVYWVAAMPDPRRTAEIWREEAQRAGVGELYLAAVESHDAVADPGAYGFDATVEFAPEWREMGTPKYQTERYDLRARLYRRLRRYGLLSPAYWEHSIHSYDSLVRQMTSKPERAHAWFRCVTPAWDNSPRRREGGLILYGSTPERYGAWLSHAIEQTRARPAAEQIVFVNAWNEWAEGNHLEPDLRWGRAYLEATARAVASVAVPGKAAAAETVRSIVSVAAEGR
jgi:lipopolysaccharide biosynthesis protein